MAPARKRTTKSTAKRSTAKRSTTSRASSTKSKSRFDGEQIEGALVALATGNLTSAQRSLGIDAGGNAIVEDDDDE